MEARALHDFAATQSDELAFQKGNILKVCFLSQPSTWSQFKEKNNKGITEIHQFRI